MSFRLVQKSVTFNDFERRNGVIVRYFNEFWYLLGARRKSSRSLSHLLMSSYLPIHEHFAVQKCVHYYCHSNKRQFSRIRQVATMCTHI